MSRTTHSDAVAHVQEANRLFLSWLQTLDDPALEPIGFPLTAAPALRRSDSAALGALADFPRALFRLRFSPAAAVRAPGLNEIGAASVLTLTLLYCVWSISRESTYLGRLFFGLTPREAHALRTTPLSDLPGLALGAVSVECAFAGAAWLWDRLLDETRPERRRQLVLAALQPAVEVLAAGEDRVAERLEADSAPGPA
ncbi:MAG TPA: hypothetical protein VFV10_01295 [Gammaproteobacteria bacterium]|nr:hypothetical protein [Gammaproteobacteria bacterium]